MIIIPEHYEELNLTASKKRLLLNLKSTLTDDYYLFLEVNPTGRAIIPFVLMHKEKGLLCISIDEINTENFESYVQVMRGTIWAPQEDILQNKFRKERILNGKEGGLKFKYNWVYFFTNTNRANSILNKEYLDYQCWFKNEFSNDKSKIDKFFNSNKNSITEEIPVALNEDEFNNLGYIIAPHYYIPRQSILLNDEDKKNKKILNQADIKNGDRYVRAMMLDPEQINLINNLSFGDQLMLACAGSGKSAVLISKAFKLASVNPDKDVLITCYNNNLAQFYRWQIDVAGFNEKNVKCRTFHALCQDLLINNGVKIPYSSFSETYHDDVFKLAERCLNDGRILTRFDAIFIDEVQIYKREWYIFCYNLLKDKDPNNHIFVICGDKSQNVNNNIEKGIAPWQVNIDGFPTFETNTIRIETNYRNSVEINSYINNFVSVAKEYFTELNVAVQDQDDLFLRGHAKRPGKFPEIHLTNRNEEVKKVFQIIEELNERHNIPYSDIAILIPQRQFKKIKYFILQWLLDEFNERYLDRTLLLNDENEFTAYGDRKGVSICTVESALGLDFRAVIVCGLLPMGVYDKSDKDGKITEEGITEEESLLRKQSFFKNVNQLYTAMTRARDELHVLISNPESIYSKILLETRDRVKVSC